MWGSYDTKEFDKAMWCSYQTKEFETFVSAQE